jgi:hypothetical protein
MDMAFHPDGRTALIGNQGDGTISVLDLAQASSTGLSGRVMESSHSHSFGLEFRSDASLMATSR